MDFRTAFIEDIPAMQVVRNSVKENALSDPALVPDKDYVEYMTVRGKGWVCEEEGKILGFAIADLKEENIWALFILPEYEGRGIGKRLHQVMMDWYFSQNKETVWLGTAFNTRAETFYRMQGWREAGTNGPKELKFEMRAEDWRGRRV
jgi:GNAT superfamily N-acetyltransferase